MTGDVVIPEVQEFLERNQITYVEKPFTLRQLEELIADLQKRRER